MSRELTPFEREEFERRKEIALAQLGAFVDVASAWRGRYEDDDEPASWGWLKKVTPQCQEEPFTAGWLCKSGTAIQAIGWKIDQAIYVCDLAGHLKGKWPFTRRVFREAACINGVCLPLAHVTARDELCREWEQQQADYLAWLRERRRQRHATHDVPTCQCSECIVEREVAARFATPAKVQTLLFSGPDTVAQEVQT